MTAKHIHNHPTVNESLRLAFHEKVSCRGYRQPGNKKNTKLDCHSFLIRFKFNS